MAELHRAELTPSKFDLIAAWAPDQPWFAGEAGAEIGRVGAFRLDDPAGEVGVETMLVRFGDGPLLQIPLTYRDAPLDGGDPWLIGTMQHSVLGERWCYDGTGDPVYLAVVGDTARTGGGQAEEWINAGDGSRELREPTVVVVGSGGSDRADAASAGAASAGGAGATAAPVSTRQASDATVADAGEQTVVVARHIGSEGPDSHRLRDLAGADPSARTDVVTATWGMTEAPHTLALVLSR